MQLVGGNADLRPQAELETIGEARGRIHDHRAGIHFAQEAPRPGDVFGDDGVGVLRTVDGDVLDRLVEVIHHAHGEDGGEIFGVPVFFGGGFHL